MIVRVEVKPSLYRWASERSGLDLDELARRFPKLPEWMAGDRLPTLKQIEKFAQATGTAVGNFNDRLWVVSTIANTRNKQWCTSVVDVGNRQLIDIVAGKTVNSAEAWFRSQSSEWRDGTRWAVLDMSGSYRTAYDRILPNALQVADPFHVIRLAKSAARRSPTQSPQRNPRAQGPQS